MASRASLGRKRRLEQRLEERVTATDRFVDISVRLCTVVQDPNGEELLEGCPKLRVVREQVYGGIVDTRRARPAIITTDPKFLSPITWYCSEEQEPIVVHADDEPLGQLVYGSEGAGKSTALIQWLYFRWLELLGGRYQIGVSAPIEGRLSVVLEEFRRAWPASWYWYRTADDIAQLCDGTLIRFRSTYQQSAAQGSRWQGFNLAAHAGDEFQDSLNVADDIEMRGRSAPRGRYKRLCTATAKDSPEWRAYRDKLDRAKGAAGKPLWRRVTLLGERSPFIAPEFWIAKRANLSPREARRRLDALDVGPERATYPTWERAKNLVDVPEIGWRDITAETLAHFTGQMRTVLVGHDPGNLVDVSLFLKRFQISRAEAARIGAPTVTRRIDGTVVDRPPPIWVVLDEVNTEQTTTDAHVRAVLERARMRWHCNLFDRHGRLSDGPQIFVRADPAGENDNRTDISVYTQWRNYGVDMRPAAYSKKNPTQHGRVPLDAGIEMVTMLIGNDLGERRLFVARRPDGQPAAPKLVAAIETSERDLAGKADTQRKRKGDMSHWPAALRYALWAIERPRLGQTGDAGVADESSIS